MRLRPLPARACWRHHTAREADEIVSCETTTGGTRLRGVVAGIEEGLAFALAYEIQVDQEWSTQQAFLRSLLPGDETDVLLRRDAAGRWEVDGRVRADLDDIVDVDLEGRR